MIPLILAFIVFLRSLIKMLKEPEFRSLLTLVIITLVLGTVVYHNIEGWRWLDSLYFSVIVLTTIGFGDFAPTTDIGKIFTVIYVFLGLGILLGFVNATGEYFRKQQKERISGRHKKIERELSRISEDVKEDAQYNDK
ncbi:potassium channel family protein [Methanolobus halotolerans]|uniref:Two pore domain potassium channel family protein n=1 Tax=Methanolobus halotolerans TaxID=2052935 RepID=A0A4E0QZF5_9EURY|nr:potassium channel family protein [Methanolobus halotolerans]TGC09144.1 two pore domain potassium channel family protein [Methanolobus halotolerans]